VGVGEGGRDRDIERETERARGRERERERERDLGLGLLGRRRHGSRKALEENESGVRAGIRKSGKLARL